MGKPMLYVEDEENDVFLLKRSFQTIGISDPFEVVGDGKEAIDYLGGEGKYAERALYPLPLLVLLDLNLPRHSGFEVLEWRRGHALARTIPVVVLTSSNTPEDIQRSYELGANGYVVKSPDPSGWIKRASAIRDFWLGQNSPPLVCQSSGGKVVFS